MIKKVIKRDGRVVDFNNQKIVAAILKAMNITEGGEDIVLAAKIADVISKYEKETMSVEEIQDCVEMELMESPRKEVAKKYIAYRNQRSLARNAKSNEIFQEIIDAQANDITRWRIEPKTEDIDKYFAGQLVEPQKPIVFYVDTAFPEKWRKTIREGICCVNTLVCREVTYAIILQSHLHLYVRKCEQRAVNHY